MVVSLWQLSFIHRIDYSSAGDLIFPITLSSDISNQNQTFPLSSPCLRCLWWFILLLFTSAQTLYFVPRPLAHPLEPYGTAQSATFFEEAQDESARQTG